MSDLMLATQTNRRATWTQPQGLIGASQYLEGGNVYLRILLSVLLVALAFASSGCGGGASGNSGDSGNSNPPPPGAYTVVHKFSGGADGMFPNAGLLRNAAGEIFGTTWTGGSSGYGTVFKLDASGSETVLYSFTGSEHGPDGGFPGKGLVQDVAGNVYGTTLFGGVSGYGTVFKLDAAGNETVLYSFTGGEGGPDGAYPSGVIGDEAGNLYGTTQFGGTAGSGTVFKLDSAGRYKVVYSFTSDFSGPDGAYPAPGLLRDAAGNIYGATYSGGVFGHGAVFKLDASGAESVLYSFTGGEDGEVPLAPLTRDESGNLYGTTQYNAGASGGTVFKLDANGQLTTLHSFAENAEGADPGGQGPCGGLLLRADNLYGAAGGGTSKWGVVFGLNVESGVETVLHTFTGKADGGGPNCPLIADDAGYLYGTAGIGGDLPCHRPSEDAPFEGCGVVFKIKLP